MRGSEEDLRRALAQWKTKSHSPGLADRIVRHATALPQRLPLRLQWQDLVANTADLVATRYFRHAGMAAAALSVIALLGFSTGYLSDGEETASTEMEDLIAVDMSWLEDV